MNRPLRLKLIWVFCLGLVLPCATAAAQEGPQLPTFTFPKGTPTESDYWRGWVDFHAGNLTDNYAQHSAGAAEAKQAAPAYFRAVIEMLAAKRREMAFSADALADLLKQGEALGKLQADDPLIHYCQGAVLLHAGKPNDAGAKFDAALQGIETSKYPRWLIFPIAYERHRLLLRNGFMQVVTPSQAKLIEHLPAWLARAADAPDARRYLWDLYQQAWDYYEFNPQGKQQALLEAFSKQETKEPWLWEMAQGEAKIEAGWQFRGRGFANTVTPEGAQKFSEQMELADQHLCKAYELVPEYPESATKLITVSMAGFDDETVVYWFERAIAAQCDYPQAFHNFVWSLRPRWGGSHELMLAFAEQCARSRRFETGIPYFYFTISNDVRLERDVAWTEYIKDPQVYKRLTYVLKHLANDPSRTVEGRKLSNEQSYYLTQHLVLSAHDQQVEDVEELIARLGDDMQPQVFREMQSSYPFGVARVFANKQFSKELDKLRAEVSPPNTDPLKAHTWLTELKKLAQLNKNPQAEPYFTDVLRRGQMEVDFHDGKWVELTFDPNLVDWNMTSNQWTYESEKSVIASSIGSDAGFCGFHVSQFPGPREIMCNIEVIESFVPYLFLGIYHGNFRDEGAMFWIEQERKQLGAAKWAAENLPYIPINVPKLDHLHVRIWGADQVELYGNGRWQTHITKGEEYAQDPEKWVLNRVGLGAMWCRPSTSTVRFSNVRVRKLVEAVPPWSRDGVFNDAEIIAYYNRELEANPDFAYGYLNRGLAYSNQQTYAEAVTDFERGLALVPEATGYRGLMGSALCQLGKYGEGIAQLERTLAEASPHRLQTGSETAYAAFFFATVPDDKLRNGDRALELATKSCEATKYEEFYPLLALTAAQAEKGQFDAALATLDKLTALAKSDDLKAALDRYRESFKAKKPWRHNAEQAKQDAYWIDND